MFINRGNVTMSFKSGCALMIAAAVPVLAVAAPAAAQTGAMPAPAAAEGTVLEIAAEGSTTRAPELAVIEAGVTTEAATAEAAMRDNAARMASVIAALRKAGVAERDIQTARIALNPRYRYDQNQPPVLTGYAAANQVRVRFRDLARTGTILDSLVRAGANDINGPQMTLVDPEAARDAARADAVSRARARAELYARAAGMSVARILSISEQGAAPVMPMPMMRMEAAKADASTPVATGELTLTANVTVRFLLR